MSLDNVKPGKKIPESFNVIIEIPMNADPIKYEVDKESGAIFVDRFMGTAMHYPCNYVYINKTIAGDGDPVDVLVITPFPLIPGVVVSCRALGVLMMEDEGGQDARRMRGPHARIVPVGRRLEASVAKGFDLASDTPPSDFHVAASEGTDRFRLGSRWGLKPPPPECSKWQI